MYDFTDDRVINKIYNLRGGLDVEDYDYIVIGLIFIRSLSNTTYNIRNDAQWQYIKDNIDKDIINIVSNAMDVIQKDNIGLKGIIQNKYYLINDKNLIKLINIIDNLNLDTFGFDFVALVGEIILILMSIRRLYDDIHFKDKLRKLTDDLMTMVNKSVDNDLLNNME